MSAKLVAEEGSLKGLVLSLEDGDQWVIGRDPDACQLLVEDPSTSRKHLICRNTPDGILVENLSSTNPTEINDEVVSTPRLLQNGDTVKIGDEFFRFYAEEAAQLVEGNGEPPSLNNGTLIPEGIEIPVDTDPGHEDAAALEEKPQEAKQEEITPPNNSEPAEVSQINAETPTQDDKAPMQDLEITPETEAETTANPPPSTSTPSHEERTDTIYEEESADKNVLAEINFGFLETGRWLLKVIGGPNNGAEFSMQTNFSYVIGTDPNACDIVFHDTSVSRQHARITVSPEDTLTIEDLKSRNGTMVDGEAITAKRPLPANTVVSLGTTSFVIFDREGEMQTIISPLMPAIVKALKEEPTKPESGSGASLTPAIAPLEEKKKPEEPSHHNTLGAFILIGILTGLFVIVGIGTSTLFKSEPVVMEQAVDPLEALDLALSPFPSIKYSYNKNTGQLLLVGHVLTPTDRSQLLYTLQGMKFLKSLDDSGIVIDEYVWREINQVIEKNPDWRGINVIATSPGHFVVSGYLQKRLQADHLSEYLSANFPYPDLLEKRIIVDEEVTSSVNSLLQNKGLATISAKLDNGEVVLTGGFAVGKKADLNAVIEEIKKIRGIRGVRNTTVEQAPEETYVNVSDKYDVTGVSNQGGRLSVVINGRILMKGDTLDSMVITQIQPNSIMLEKGNVRYRINFNR